MTAAAFPQVAQLAQRLRTRSWRDMAKCAWLVLLGMLLLKWLLPADLENGMRPLILVVPLLPFIAKDLSHWPDALARLRAAIANRAWTSMLHACWPPELIGLLRLDAALRHGFVQWLRRRPQPAPPAGQAFSYLERGAYRTGIVIALMAALFELPLDAALLPLLPPTLVDPHKVHVLHAVLAIGVLSTLVWVLGDRWHIGRGCHVLTADGLELRVGARTSGTIPLVAIADCRRIDVETHIWCRREGIERHRALAASPLDKPNTALMLKPDSRVRLTHLGVERTGLACVFLYVDQPDRLIRAVRSERQQ